MYKVNSCCSKFTITLLSLCLYVGSFAQVERLVDFNNSSGATTISTNELLFFKFVNQLNDYEINEVGAKIISLSPAGNAKIGIFNDEGILIWNSGGISVTGGENQYISATLSSGELILKKDTNYYIGIIGDGIVVYTHPSPSNLGSSEILSDSSHQMYQHGTLYPNIPDTAITDNYEVGVIALVLKGTALIDTDNDGIFDINDDDDDNDGVIDSEDAFPLDDTESVDTDNDGIGNNADTDDDNDGVSDTSDAFPLDETESIDTDNDGTGNNADPDDDNDGVNDIDDAFPTNATEHTDTDNDGIGNNTDTDDDNDGVSDDMDSFPLDETEQIDTDGDGIGNNADTDDDNDGITDDIDDDPLVSIWATGTKSNIIDQVRVYPNPSSHFIEISTQDPQHIISYKIISTDGREVIHGNIVEDNSQIRIDDLKDGIYTIVLSIDNKVITKKLIKK